MNSELAILPDVEIDDDLTLPLIVRSTKNVANPAYWFRDNAALIEDDLRTFGAIMFRNFRISEATTCEIVADELTGGGLEYAERSSPRTLVSGHVYTSTDYPPREEIFLHNESSYQHQWPLTLYFFCLQAPRSGGATPIADSRRILSRIDPAVRLRFDEQRWMLVRNYGVGAGLDWPAVYGTDDRGAVERYCVDHDLTFEWVGDDALRTSAIRDAVRVHPLGEPTWFNHIAFFHVSTLRNDIAEALMTTLGEENLPTNTYYGDGAPIEDEVLSHIRECYIAEKKVLPWQPGDALVIDNMLTSHGRQPYEPPRTVLVVMSQLHSEAPASRAQSSLGFET